MSSHTIAKQLIQKHKIPVKQARYREDGKWYHHLKDFPAAFLDKEGYIIYRNEEDYRKCNYLQLGQDVHILKGISSIPGYVTYDFDLSKIDFIEFTEGGTKEIVLELQKRDPSLKHHAIEQYGLTCQVCNFNFEQFYGAIGAGYIEVHHIQPLSANRERQTTLQDIAIVCANCHRVLHRSGEIPLSIEELKNAINLHKKI